MNDADISETTIEIDCLGTRDLRRTPSQSESRLLKENFGVGVGVKIIATSGKVLLLHKPQSFLFLFYEQQMQNKFFTDHLVFRHSLVYFYPFVYVQNQALKRIRGSLC
jgi:hypothetical protein